MHSVCFLLFRVAGACCELRQQGTSLKALLSPALQRKQVENVDAIMRSTSKANMHEERTSPLKALVTLLLEHCDSAAAWSLSMVGPKLHAKSPTDRFSRPSSEYWMTQTGGDVIRHPPGWPSAPAWPNPGATSSREETTGISVEGSIQARSQPCPRTATERIFLGDGNSMPVVGLGTYRMMPGKETYQSVRWALEAGYRMIDTAQVYQNEKAVGQAIRDSGIPREEIFVQSKLWNDFHGFKKARVAVQHSLQEAGFDYFDSFLIHSPYGEKLVETWDALLSLQREGYLRSVGVSNFGIKHLQALRAAGRPMPAVNQFEMHPLIYRSRLDLIQFCQSRGILVQAYGSMFGENQQALQDHRLLDIYRAHPDKTESHILLRWALQQGFQVIPKSVRNDRIQDNVRLFDFELTSSQMHALSNWQATGLGEYWNPVKDVPVDLKEADEARVQKLMDAYNLDLQPPLLQPPAGTLGPPAHFDGLTIGPYELNVSRYDALDGTEFAFGVQKLAARPACFFLRGVMSNAECNHFVADIQGREVHQQTTLGGAKSRNGCSFGCVDVKQDPVAAELVGLISELLLTQEVRDVEAWGRGSRFENMELFKYEKGDQLKLGHDAKDNCPRTLTVLFHLADTGETWFPLATLDPTAANPLSIPDAQGMLEGLEPGRDGLLCSAGKGDAIAFYNYCDDGSGCLDRLAFYAGLPATDKRLIATLRYCLGYSLKDNSSIFKS